MPAIFFALISYLGWGIGDIFGTIATRKIGGYSVAFWYLFFQFAILIFFFPLFLEDLNNLTIPILVLNLTLGILGTLAFVPFYEGLRIGNASVVGTIAGSFAAVTVLLSIIFLGERVNSFQVIAITTIFIGIIICSLDFQTLLKDKLLANKGILFAIITAILWGIYWAFIKIPVEHIGWFWPQMISLITFPILLPFFKIKRLKLENPLAKGVFYHILANSILLAIAAFSFNYAIGQNLTAIVAPIAGSYPTLFAFLAFLVFKDRITKQQIAGIVITLLGIVFLSIYSY